MNNWVKSFLAVWAYWFATSAFATCAWCSANAPGVCSVTSGVGFASCSQGSCSGDCPALPPLPAPGGGGGGWEPCLIDSGGPCGCGGCFPNDPDEWGLVAKLLPDVEPGKEVAYVNVTCTDCVPPKKGPALIMKGSHNLLADARGNWLLMAALHHFELGGSQGMSDVGAITFVFPENDKQQQAMLDGLELAPPINPLKGFGGLATYHSKPGIDAMNDPATNRIEVEMKVWKVNLQKGAPVQGLTAWLRYEKGANGFALASVKTDTAMPEPNLAFFPNVAKHLDLVNGIKARKP